MTNAPLLPHPRFEELCSECELLKEEAVALIAERDYLLNTVGPNLAAQYQVEIGVLRYELLRVDVETRTLKRKIELLQAAANRGESLDPEELERQLEAELRQWRARVEKLAEEVAQARYRLGHLLSAEESAELRHLYRSLAKKLHPDVNPEQGREASELWLRVLEAYEAGDLEELRALALLAEDFRPQPYSPDSLAQLEQRRETLKEQVQQLIHRLAEIKQSPPFDLAAQLGDPDWVAQRQQEITAEISALKQYRCELQAVIELTEGGGCQIH